MLGPPYFYIYEDKRLINARVLGLPIMETPGGAAIARLDLIAVLQTMTEREVRMTAEAASLIIEQRRPLPEPVGEPANVIAFPTGRVAASSSRRTRPG